MTKLELIEMLKDVDDDATIGALRDDCEWSIRELYNGKDFDFVIDCD